MGWANFPLPSPGNSGGSGHRGSARGERTVASSFPCRAATMRPSGRHTSGRASPHTRSISGARINTPGNGAAPSVGHLQRPSQSWPPGGQRHCAPPRCPSAPAGRLAAHRLGQQDRPGAGAPHGMRLPKRPQRLDQPPARRPACPMVVDSPPGRISPSSPSSSPGRRTARVSTPSRASTARCSAKSPCRASTPTRMLYQPRPASSSRSRHCRDRAAHHGLAQARG